MGQQVRDYLLSPGCMASLSTSGEFVRNEIINVSLFIFNQLEHTSDYYFNLHFMHLLIGDTGYNYDAVNSWTGTTNIFTKQFLHFSLVFNKRHVHFVVHVAEKLIIMYDFLGVNQVEIAKVILRYLCDEFQSVYGRVQVPTLPLLMDNFNIDDWRLDSVFTHCSSFIKFNPVNSGVYLLKLIELLRQPTSDLASLSEDKVDDYRAALTATIREFQN